MEATTTTRPLEAGDVIQYRRVGTARLIERQAPFYDLSDNGGWWAVEWIKAPKKYRESANLIHGPFWVNARDRV